MPRPSPAKPPRTITVRRFFNPVLKITPKTSRVSFWFAATEDAVVDSAANKVSLAFSVENRAGSLVAALNELSALGVNLTKIESRPVHGHPWEYIFYVDYQIHSLDEADRALDALRPHCSMVKELGRYREAATPRSES